MTDDAREALMKAADHLLPGDKVGSDWLIYLAVTRYGTSDYDPAVAEALIERHVWADSDGGEA